METMETVVVRYFMLEYWFDDGWRVGRLKKVPGVFSQGETLQELEENIVEAYRLMVEAEELFPRAGVQTKETGLEV
jgi:predicted RNase H-like HicB family nuclease